MMGLFFFFLNCLWLLITVDQLPLFSSSVCAAAERRETRRREEKLLEAAREGDISTLSKLVSF